MVTVISEKDFDKLTSKGKCLVDFSATWCGPCQMLAPILEEVSNKADKDFKFYKVDIDDDIELATKFDVEAVPTLIILNDGKEVDRSIGFLPAEELTKWIKENNLKLLMKTKEYNYVRRPSKY